MKRFFPYDEVRDEQDKLLDAVGRALTSGGQLVAHAPTGLGKTAATLSPALRYAIEHDKTVFFLTGRHTQHRIALETLSRIKERHNLDFETVDLIGKRWFCLQPNAERLRSKEFTEYCKAMKEDKQCTYYERLKKGEELSPTTKAMLGQLRGSGPHSTEELKRACAAMKLCPYEIAVLLARKASVIICDYNYLFTASIATRFLQKINRELKDVIIIVDEAHNLPDRTKEQASARLSTLTISRAISEAEKYKYDDLFTAMKRLKELLERMGLTISENERERYVTKEDFTNRLKKIAEPEELIGDLTKAGDAIREEQQHSYLGAIGAFLTTWQEGKDEGFTRILEESTYKDEELITLHYRCLDPSVMTAEILNGAHASILMSGTLSPTRMYKELLGVLHAEELSLDSPFPHENRLTIVVPKTTTKFTQRSDAMYKEIAEHCARVINTVPGNSAVFFPSYALLYDVLKHLDPLAEKTIFAEQRGMTKEEKRAFLERFKEYKNDGAVLLGVITGSFGEGIDLPGDELKGVVVVGLPLQKPDLETKSLIEYFDNKFGRGWEYGYTFPAFNKTLQSAGRCIRSEKDRGVLVFLDERYDWPQYKRCFPADWKIVATVLYEGQIKKFFEDERTNKDLRQFTKG